MKILATKDAVQFIRQRGGGLYVWADLTQCPGCSFPFLAVSTEPPPEQREFTRLSGGDFDLFYSDGYVERPGQLIVELSGWRKKRL